MNVIDSRPLRQTSLVLPLVGIVVSLTVVVDFTMRLFDPDIYKPEGLFSLLNELIDRGVILLIGLALVSAGFWLNKALIRPATDSNISANSPLSNPQFWTFVFASLLGLLFLVLVPFHYSISGQVLNQMVSTASARADQQEAQARYIFQQRQEQANNLIAKGQVDQLLQQKNLSQEEFAFLQAIKQDPKAVDKKAAQSLAELKTQKQQALDQINKGVNSPRWRVEVRSVLLAIGFVALGWTGLRDAS
jgi:hypothetical protein